MERGIVSTAIAPTEFCVLPESEEVPMTMQVGMVGKDGIVLASDTRWTMKARLENQSWAGAEFGVGSSKIKIDAKRGIAIACAADMRSAQLFADAILAALKQEDFVHPEAVVRDTALKTLPDVTERTAPQCILVLTRPSRRIFLCQFAYYNNKLAPECLEMENLAIAGHNTNAAIFWAERYSRYFQEMTIKKLIPLASHLIVSAEMVNPGGVAGLEIAYCDRTGLHRLSKEKNRKWHSKATAWDARITEMILGHSARSKAK
jgi:hypothetical protein